MHISLPWCKAGAGEVYDTGTRRCEAAHLAQQELEVLTAL